MKYSRRQIAIAVIVGLVGLAVGKTFWTAIEPTRTTDVRPRLGGEPRSELVATDREEGNTQDLIADALSREVVPREGAIRVEGRITSAASGALTSLDLGGVTVTLRWQRGTASVSTAEDATALAEPDGGFAFLLDQAEWRVGSTYQIMVSDAQRLPLFRGYVALGPFLEIPVAQSIEYRGWFVDAAGLPLVGTFALFESAHGGARRLLSGSTDEQGGFRMRGPSVSSEKIDVRFSSPSIGLVEFGQVVSADELARDGAVIVVAARFCRLQVVDSASEPVSLASVRYRSMGVERLAEAMTGSDGVARLWHCGGGTDVYVVHDLLAPHHVQLEELPEELQVVVPPRVVQQVDGMVINPSGGPVDMAGVIGFADVGSVDPVADASAQTETSPDGRFSLSVPVSSKGRFNLWVMHPEASNVTVKTHGLTARAEFLRVELPSVQSVTLKPHALLPGGAAAEAPPRYVLASRQAQWYRSGSIMGGQVRMSLPDGDYTALVALGGMAGSIDFSVAGAAITEQVGLIPARVVRIEVRSSGHRVVFDLRHRILGQMPDGFLPTACVSAGVFDVMVPASGGTYEVGVSAGGDRVSVAVEDSDTYSVRLP